MNPGGMCVFPEVRSKFRRFGYTAATPRGALLAFTDNIHAPQRLKRCCASGIVLAPPSTCKWSPIISCQGSGGASMDTLETGLRPALDRVSAESGVLAYRTMRYTAKMIPAEPSHRVSGHSSAHSKSVHHSVALAAADVS